MYGLFLFSIGTDLLDGFIAKKLNAKSKFGANLDVVIDFLFIFSTYLFFVLKGIYSPFLLLPIIIMFMQFVVTNQYLRKTIYDPIGKYYGSLLFGGLGLTLLFQTQIMYDIVTLGIIVITIASILSRFKHFRN
jgi:phosphatidylglycerophosphate synthase